MGFEAYALDEEEYKARIARLSDIAVRIYNSSHGDFLRTLAHAWLRADMSNKRILRPCWSAIVTKYDLDKEAED